MARCEHSYLKLDTRDARFNTRSEWGLRVKAEVRSKDSVKPAERTRGGREKDAAFLLSRCFCLLFAEGPLLVFFCYCCLFQHLCFKELNAPSPASVLLIPPPDSLTGPRTRLQRALRSPVCFLFFSFTPSYPIQVKVCLLITGENTMRHLKCEVS